MFIGTHVYSTEDSPLTDEELTSNGAMQQGSPKLGSAMVNCTGTRVQIPDGTMVNVGAVIATSQLNQIFDSTAREKKTRQQSECLNRQRRRHMNSSCCTGYQQMVPTVATAFTTEGNPSTESSLCVTSYTTSKNTSRTCTDISDRCYGADSLPVQLPPLVPKLLKKSTSVDQPPCKASCQEKSRRISLPQIHHLGGLTTQNSSTVLSRQQYDLMIVGMRQRIWPKR